MAVQTFNPTDLSQSATNWAVAQRIVGPFAPHAQVTPNLTLALDPGFLLSGTTLTEVNAQNVGPFAPPSSGFRIDRVVIDRSTGAASIVTGAANSLTPPAIPSGKLPVARALLQATTDAITNAVIVDERALSDLTPQTTNQMICRATRNNVDQTGITNTTFTKVLFSATDFNIGGGFDVANHWFKPTAPGYYTATFQGFMSISANHFLQVAIYKNGAVVSASSAITPIQFDCTARITDTVYLNGTSDYLEAYVYHNNGSTTTLYGSSSANYFNVTLVS